MQNGPSYRVYTPTDLKCLAPVAYRSAPPPPSRGGFAIAFVLFVGLVIGGGSFAALRFFEVDLSGARTSLAAPSAPPVTPPLAPPAVASAAPAAPSPVAADAELTPGNSARRKPHGHRRNAAPAAVPSASSALDLPRGPVVVRAPSAPTALPPNPF